MISKAQIKFIQSLRLNKHREIQGLFVVEGEKSVNELLKSSFQIHQLFATSEWVAPALLQYNIIEAWELQKISGLTNPNQVLAVVKIPYLDTPLNVTNELVLLLDKISDPGNMGTIIRTAEWFGINRILASTDSVDCWNPKVVQASMGSLFRMPVHYLDVNDFLNRQSDIAIYGTLFDGESLGSLPLTRFGIIVVGNESNGISKSNQKFITRKLTIKPASLAATESLNVSMATAIVCYEFRRQFPL